MDSAQSAQTVSLLGLVALILKHQLLETQPLNRLNNIDIARAPAYLLFDVFEWGRWDNTEAD